MTTATLLAAILLGPAPIQFEIRLSNTTVKPGEPVRVELIAKNATKKPLVMARAIWDGAPAAGASSALEHKGTELRFTGDSSMPLAQVMVSNKVDKDRFVTLEAGQSTVVYWTEITAYYEFQRGSTTRSKEDYAKAAIRPLPPGTYQCTVSYQFDRDAVARAFRHEWSMALAFQPGAEALWNAAVNTRYTGKRTFVVR